MRHVYVEGEDAIYSFTENSVVKTAGADFEKAQLGSNPAITYVNQNPIFYAGIALTNQCNCDCRYCLVDTTKSSERHIELSIADFSSLLHGLSEQGLVRASITGGEPFTYPHLINVFKLLFQYGIPANLNTNGTLLKPEIIEELIGYGLVEIDVSVTDLYNDSDVYLDGVNRAKTRLENLENLVKRFKGKILVTASSVLTRKAVGNLQEIESVLYNIGVDRWRLREVLVSESNETAEYLYGDPREFASTLIGFAAAEHKIPITGYLYDVIATKRKDRRCSNLERNYIYVNYNREVYWLARLSNKSFDEFRGNNIPEIAYNLHNVCYQLEIPHRCINCPANYFCVESPYCAFEIPLSN